MNAKPEVGTRVKITTKPFVDSETTRENEVTFLGADAIHWLTERRPGSRHYVPISTIISWSV